MFVLAKQHLRNSEFRSCMMKTHAAVPAAAASATLDYLSRLFSVGNIARLRQLKISMNVGVSDIPVRRLSVQ